MSSSPHQRAIFLHPGQGTQKVGMGSWLFRRSSTAREILSVVEERAGIPLARVMASGPAGLLDDTRFAQPAILAVNVACSAVAQDHLRPIATAGHSVGEIAALVTAGALDLEQAATLVARRSSLMSGVERPGAMGVIMGLSECEIRAACQELSAQGTLVLALANAPDHYVVAGDPGLVQLCLDRVGASAESVRTRVLRTSNAFHSPIMDECRDAWRRAVEAAEIERPHIPIALNASGELSSSVDAIRNGLIDQLCSTVRWTDCMNALDAEDPDLYVECGHGRFLSGINRSTRRRAHTVSLEAPTGLVRIGSAA